MMRAFGVGGMYHLCLQRLQAEAPATVGVAVSHWCCFFWNMLFFGNPTTEDCSQCLWAGYSAELFCWGFFVAGSACILYNSASLL
jgi:hypothetical protein